MVDETIDGVMRESADYARRLESSKLTGEKVTPPHWLVVATTTTATTTTANHHHQQAQALQQDMNQQQQSNGSRVSFAMASPDISSPAHRSHLLLTHRALRVFYTLFYLVMVCVCAFGHDSFVLVFGFIIFFDFDFLVGNDLDRC